MRPDHTATELAQPHARPAAPLDGAGESVPQRRVRVLTRVTFCFAWLLGLEPFLTEATDDARRSRLDRH